MKAGELIEELKKFNKDLDVYMGNGGAPVIDKIVIETDLRNDETGLQDKSAIILRS